MKIEKKRRRILIEGKIVETTKKPKYVFGLYEKDKKIWHYVCRGTIYTHYIGRAKRVFISRYTKEKIKELKNDQRLYSSEKDFFNSFKTYKFKKFKKTIGSVSDLILIDSVDDWLKHLKTYLLDESFRIEKLKEIFRRR